MYSRKHTLLFSFFCFLFGSNFVQAQINYLEYADSTQILLVFDNEQDTLEINTLKRELQATELASTPFTRIHLWQIPLDTIAAYGGVSNILNHAIGKPRIKGGSMNYSVPLVFNIDDDDDDQDEPQGPLCYEDSLFDCVAGTTVVNMAFLDTGFDGDPTGLRSVWMPTQAIFNRRPWQNSAETNKTLNIDSEKNGFIDDVKGWDFHFNDNVPKDDQGHGSHTAGLAALKQLANNDSSRNKIMILKTHNQAGKASMWQLVQALDYALRYNIKIVNLSLAYWSPVNPSGKPSVMEYIMEFGKTYKGMLFVAAAGNEAINIDQPITLSNGVQVNYYPAALPNDNLIVVGAGTCSNELASFSNYGPTNVDIVAPGIDIYSSLLSGSYGYLTGTSMAAPHVTAAAALAASRQNIFNWKRIKYDLLNRSNPSPTLNGLVSSGRMLTFCDNYLPSPNPLLVIAKANKVLCIGDSIMLNATATGGQGAYSFSWSNGKTGANIQIKVPGNYTVTVQDAAANVASETITVFGASAPIVQTKFQSLNCGDNCGLLEISNAVLGASYLWSIGSTKTSINICPTLLTTYSITTTTPNGCSSISTFKVAPLQPQITSLSDTTICPCTNTILKAKVLGGVGPLNYLWSPSSETTSDITININSSQTYSITVTDSRGCTTSKSALISTSCFAPAALSAVFNPQTQATTFRWTKGPCSINRTQLRWRCNSSSPWTIVTINDTSLSSRSLLLPSGCNPEWQVRSRCCNNVFSVWDSPSVARIASNDQSMAVNRASIQLYPNPTESILNVEWEGNINENKIYIYNSVGQVVLYQYIRPELNLATFDVSNLVTGLYFFRYGNLVESFSKQ